MPVGVNGCWLETGPPPLALDGSKFKGIKVLLNDFAHFVVKINLDFNVCFSYFETLSSPEKFDFLNVMLSSSLTN